MKFLSRLWTGVVAAMAGTAFGMVLHIIGAMSVGLPLDSLFWFVIGFGSIGFVAGVLIGDRSFSRKRPPSDDSDEGAMWID
ncbi:MAG: hypothetical protein HY290_04985 [Planctomycetia bacterium]|nr:hypothetical protein [Planctomycetia bacterium]